MRLWSYWNLYWGYAVTGTYIMLLVEVPICMTTLENNLYLLKLKTCISYDPTIPLLSIHWHVQETCTRTFIDKTANNPVFINRRMDRLGWMHMLEYHIVTKLNKLQLCLTIWGNLIKIGVQAIFFFFTWVVFFVVVFKLYVCFVHCSVYFTMERVKLYIKNYIYLCVFVYMCVCIHGTHILRLLDSMLNIILS